MNRTLPKYASSKIPSQNAFYECSEKIQITKKMKYNWFKRQ